MGIKFMIDSASDLLPSEAEELGVGEGNTNRGSITYVPADYTVKMVQQAFDYQDEDFMKDNTIVDNMLKGANQVMVNKMTADFTAECAKATLKVDGALSYETIVDAIAKLNVEDESGLFIITNPEGKAVMDAFIANMMSKMADSGMDLPKGAMKMLESFTIERIGKLAGDKFPAESIEENRYPPGCGHWQ